jgi:hypothetical protein
MKRLIGNGGGPLAAVKAYFTPEGGLAVKLINKTGGNSVKGNVVHANSALANSVKLSEQNIPDSIGVIYNSGIPDGAYVWVVVAGIADVLFVGDTTVAYLARTFVTADGGAFAAGYAMAEAVPSTPFASDKHFAEIGHVIEARTGAGLAKCVIHFN